MVIAIPQILVVGLGNLPFPLTRHRYVLLSSNSVSALTISAVLVNESLIHSRFAWVFTCPQIELESQVKKMLQLEIP
jgi:hypothetical protein